MISLKFAEHHVIDSPILGSVVVVEEFQAVGDLTVRILEMYGWSAQTCNDISIYTSVVDEAISRVQVVIVDVNLCLSQKWPPIERILQRHPFAGIVLTSTGLLPPLPESLQKRAGAVVLKPYLPEQLVQAVHLAQESAFLAIL